MNTKCFVVYLTANDTPFFHDDYFNLLNMCRHDPGVKQIHLYVAVSQVEEFNHFQKRLLGTILKQAENCKWLTCEGVILKTNIGRDFSSLQSSLLAMQGNASDEDFILVRNRSSRGPFSAQWYKKYVVLQSSKPGIGLVGSTINLNDHYTRGRKQNSSHVQTYAFLSQWKYLAPLLKNFPGIKAVTHVDAIIHGEIELSQMILNAEAKITSLQKPDMILDIHSQNDPVQSKFASQLDFRDIPIIHRKRQRRNLHFWLSRLDYLKLIWLLVKNKNNVAFINNLLIRKG